jgi:hypothetical protein
VEEPIVSCLSLHGQLSLRPTQMSRRAVTSGMPAKAGQGEEPKAALVIACLLCLVFGLRLMLTSFLRETGGVTSPASLAAALSRSS